MNRKSFLKRIPGAEDALAAMRGETRTQKSALASAGLRHKSRKAMSAKLKAVLEEATDGIQEELEKLTDNVPEGLAETLAVAALQEILHQDTEDGSADAPSEDDLLEEELMASDEDEDEELKAEDDEDEDEDEVKSLRKQLARSRVEKHSKQVQFLGALVTTQGELAQGFGDLAASLKAQNDQFNKRFELLEKQLQKVSSTLSMTPRSVTRVNDRIEAATEAAEKQMKEAQTVIDSFTGLPLTAEEIAARNVR